MQHFISYSDDNEDTEHDFVSTIYRINLLNTVFVMMKIKMITIIITEIF